jgi:RimJ/RimL family protein N-acetyltransferase
MKVEAVKLLKEQVVTGRYLNLRISRQQDAEFILQLRLNPQLNKFIGKTDPDVEKQRQWLQKSLDSNNDFNFIIEDKNSIPFGTIAVYNINYSDLTAEWGRWILQPFAPFCFPIESAVLLLYFAFRKLKLRKLHGGANNLNKHIVDFHKLYATVSLVDQTHTWFTFEEKNFELIKKKFKNFHNVEDRF